jgi:hypothetical protein
MNSLTSSRKREQSASCLSDTNWPGGADDSDFGSGCVSPASRRGNGLHPFSVVSSVGVRRSGGLGPCEPWYASVRECRALIEGGIPRSRDGSTAWPQRAADSHERELAMTCQSRHAHADEAECAGSVSERAVKQTTGELADLCRIIDADA